MRLREIVETSADLARTRSRKAKVERLVRCLRALGADEARAGASWLAGLLTQGRIGVGPAGVREAASAGTAGGAPLCVRDVERALEEIASLAGAGAGRERGRRLAALFARADPAEKDFLARLLLGELRQGASEGLLVEALAAAADRPLAEVRRAQMGKGSLGELAAAILGGEGLARFAPSLFRPVLPMLAQPAEDLDDALARLGEAAFEYKLDGARIQLHKSGHDVRVFSRGQRDVGDAVPEIVETARALPVREIVLDGEALAFRADGRPEPFQVTMRRFGRRLDVARLRQELPVTALFFDCLQRDGGWLLDRPAAERAAALAEAVPPALRVPRLVTGERAVASAYFEEALARGHEGLMAKSLAAPYEAGGRGFAWLKLKPAHTLDLVVLAAEWGSGRRRGWLSNLHLGARDPATGGLVMLGKTFKGLTDEMLARQTQRLLELEVSRDAWTVYVRPELVVEIAAGGVQRSPHYPAGLALRFARVRRYRPDKSPGEADTVETVRKMLGEP